MNLPASFVEYTKTLLGDEEYNKLAIALDQEQPVSIRLNPLKAESEGLSVAVQVSGTADTCFSSVESCISEIPWSANGRYLEQRLTFTFDPLFHAGYYYVQEASSMFVEQVLRKFVTTPAIMLDLCAAPGGKSTHACSVLPKGSLLVANEVIRNRSQILAENLTKWGHPNVVVTNNDPADFSGLGAFFDVVLTDVPCSGEGMFRKDAGAIEEWSPENVEICRQRQRRIISDIWPSLKPGGILVYSTCTYNTKENEENVLWIQKTFGAEPLVVEVPQEWNITGSLLSGCDIPVYRFLPHRTKGEGFFIAALRKPDTDEATSCSCPSSKKKSKKDIGSASPVTKEMRALAESWLSDSDNYLLSVEGTAISAFPKDFTQEWNLLKQHLRLVQSGLVIGEAKGKDLLPAHALVLNCILKKGVFPMQEVNHKQAIAYLRKEAVSLPETASRGYVLLTYKNVPLGFVKNIGNRANNLYPQEWRIRSGYLPEEIKVLSR